MAKSIKSSLAKSYGIQLLQRSQNVVDFFIIMDYKVIVCFAFFLSFFVSF